MLSSSSSSLLLLLLLFGGFSSFWTCAVWLFMHFFVVPSLKSYRPVAWMHIFNCCFWVKRSFATRSRINELMVCVSARERSYIRIKIYRWALSLIIVQTRQTHDFFLFTWFAKHSLNIEIDSVVIMLLLLLLVVFCVCIHLFVQFPI